MSQRNEVSQIILGFFMLIAFHIIVIISVVLIGSLLSALFSQLNISAVPPIIVFIIIASIFGIGLFQLLYVIPLIWRLRQQERWGVMKGVIICAVVTALLNGGCFLWLNTIR